MIQNHFAQQITFGAHVIRKNNRKSTRGRLRQVIRLKDGRTRVIIHR